MIQSPDKASLTELLKFWTGVGQMPDINEDLELSFPSADEDISLPVANTCFNKMVIPTRYNEYKEFVSKMDISLLYGCEGFTEV